MFGGLRTGEIGGLQWPNVDFERNGMHVRHKQSRYDEREAPKSRAGIRFVPLAPRLAEMLKGFRDAVGEDAVGYVVTALEDTPIPAPDEHGIGIPPAVDTVALPSESKRERRDMNPQVIEITA